MPIQMRSSMVEYGFAMAVLRWKGQEPFGRFCNGPLVSIANNPSTARIETVLIRTTFVCTRKDSFIQREEKHSRDFEASVAESASNVLSSSPPLHSKYSTPSRQWTRHSICPVVRPHITPYTLGVVWSSCSDIRNLLKTDNAWEENTKSRVCRVRGTQPWRIQHVVLFACDPLLVWYADIGLGTRLRERSKAFRVPTKGAILFRMEGASGQKETFGNLADIQR